MESFSQSCPSCKASKYNNPQLRLMVNVCGHSLCENCVEVLFVRGSGLCLQCRTPIRKVNFRYQLFEDPEVQKEIDIRKKILNDFNKREEDFDSMEQYDAYLEKVEEIIYKLANDIDVDETRKIVEQNKKDNKDLIKKNRSKQSSSLEFYENELMRERLLHEKRAKEEEEELAESRQQRILQKARILQGFFGASAFDELTGANQNGLSGGITTTQNPQTQQQPAITAIHQSAKSAAPQSSQFVVPASHRFLPPPSGSALFQRPLNLTPASVISSAVPASARWGMGPMAPPSLAMHSNTTPVSGGSYGPFVPPTGMAGAGLTNWATSSDFHNVHIPAPNRKRLHGSQPNQTDEIVFGKKGQTGNQADRSGTNGMSKLPGATGAPSLEEILRPYRPELCGPEPPSSENNRTRWNDLETIYLRTVVEVIGRKHMTKQPQSLTDEPCPESIAADDDLHSGDPYGTPTDQPRLRQGISAALPCGSCGISPSVFLSRCLEDSRCGLFI